MPQDDLDYYRDRLSEERAAAAREARPALAAAHHLLTEIYSERVETLTLVPPRGGHAGPAPRA